MFFSIVIPAFNVERYLGDCLDSILNQTYTSFEVVLVDDGSSDNTPAICDLYAQKDSRIKVIHTKNGGQSAARNIGTNAAGGDYIFYIDSDDFLYDNKALEKIHAAADNKDIVFFKHKKYEDETGNFKECTYSFADVTSNLSYTASLKTMIKNDAFYGMPWNKCIKREVIKKNNISFLEGISGEDMDWIYYVILSSKSLSVIDEPFMAYRQRKNSVTSSVKLKNLKDYVFILEKWKAAADRCETNEKEIVLSSLAKYFSNLLIMYTRVKDKNKHKYDKRIKALSCLLSFGVSKRPRLINKLYKTLGLKATLAALYVLDKCK